MTPCVRTRRVAATSALALALTISVSACSDDTDPRRPAESPTGTVATTASPSESPATTGTTTAPSTTPMQPPGTSSPVTSAPPPPTVGGDALDLAAFLPDGFPIPEELTITGDPTSTARQSSVRFTVPSPAETFDFYRTELPEAGFTLLPGSSDAYSPEVASGAILAESDDYALNLLIVDDEVELVLEQR